MKDITSEEIQNSAELTSAAKQWAKENMDYLNKPMCLFGSSTKVEKGSDKFNTYILYLQPADKVAAKTLCVFAEKAGCKKDCLISSGQLGMTTGQNAATKRTILLIVRPSEFKKALLAEIDKAELRAVRQGIPALFRLNGTSDLDFSDVIRARPNSLFYDYTKVISRIRKNTLTNYDLTFSGSMHSKQSKESLKKAVGLNYRIAVAFNTKGIAADSLPLPAMKSFDETDLRHLDAPNAIGYLKRKGSNKEERAKLNKIKDSFFVTEANYKDFIKLINLGS